MSYLTNQCNEVFPPMFSSKSFIVLALTLQSSTHFEFIFVQVGVPLHSLAYDTCQVVISLALTGRNEKMWPSYALDLVNLCAVSLFKLSLASTLFDSSCVESHAKNDSKFLFCFLSQFMPIPGSRAHCCGMRFSPGHNTLVLKNVFLMEERKSEAARGWECGWGLPERGNMRECFGTMKLF